VMLPPTNLGLNRFARAVELCLMDLSFIASSSLSAKSEFMSFLRFKMILAMN